MFTLFELSTGIFESDFSIDLEALENEINSPFPDPNSGYGHKERTEGALPSPKIE